MQKQTNIKFKRRLTVAGFAALILAVLAPVMAFAGGPTRDTYTMKEPADHVTFNSITNNNKLGDERNFVRVGEANSEAAYTDEIKIVPGKEYEVYIYYHNNAGSNFNDGAHQGIGIADGVKITSTFPSTVSASKKGKVSAIISATDATPKEVWDEAYFTTDSETDIVLKYVDMSAKIDLTSVAFVIPFLSEKVDEDRAPVPQYIVFSHSFIPNREKLAERIAKDKVPYDAWEREGFLTVTDTPIVDHEAVMRYVLQTCEANDWHVQSLCFDPANASQLMMQLSNDGYEVVEVFQSHKSLNESTQGFREQVYSQNIYYQRNPVLNYAMSNAAVRKNNGLIKIDKDATTKRIDPVDAVLCAYKLAMYHVFVINNLAAIDAFIDGDMD